VTHILEGDDHIILRSHVISQVMVNNQPEKLVQESEVNLIVELLQFGLHQYDTLIFGDIPHISEVIDTLAPLIHKQWGRLRVAGLNPAGEEVSLVGLIPQVLIEIGICDLLDRLNVIHGNKMGIKVHELNADLFEGAMAEEVPLYSRESFMGVIISLLNQRKLISL
jgi:hypothetical protein